MQRHQLLIIICFKSSRCSTANLLFGYRVRGYWANFRMKSSLFKVLLFYVYRMIIVNYYIFLFTVTPLISIYLLFYLPYRLLRISPDSVHTLVLIRGVTKRTHLMLGINVPRLLWVHLENVEFIPTRLDRIYKERLPRIVFFHP